MLDTFFSSSVVGAVPFLFFLIMLVLQSVMPRRDPPTGGLTRMGHNLLLFVFNTVLMRLLIPLTLVSIAVWSQQQEFGLFNRVSVPQWLSILLCVLALDMAIYWQHVATHKLPILWRMHKVHHADTEMDVTTAVRFHPFELILSIVYKGACLLVLGAPILAVLIFELLLFIGPAFNHSNLTLPVWLDKLLRYVIATPDTHRAHHSQIIEEQNTNYGFFIIWWDKMFGTYTEVPKEGHLKMAIGLKSPVEDFRRVDQMLLAPFRK